MIFIFNSDKSQLIFTSQETTLLSQDMINENRGVVWFVEKNKETASSEYARGDSFGLHKNLSLYNSYRIDIGEMLERNKDRCYEIINKGDGVYFGRKTFMRLYIVLYILWHRSRGGNLWIVEVVWHIVNRRYHLE